MVTMIGFMEHTTQQKCFRNQGALEKKYFDLSLIEFCCAALRTGVPYLARQENTVNHLKLSSFSP